jgi:hypothetical protein
MLFGLHYRQLKYYLFIYSIHISVIMSKSKKEMYKQIYRVTYVANINRMIDESRYINVLQQLSMGGFKTYHIDDFDKLTVHMQKLGLVDSFNISILLHLRDTNYKKMSEIAVLFQDIGEIFSIKKKKMVDRIHKIRKILKNKLDMIQSFKKIEKIENFKIFLRTGSLTPGELVVQKPLASETGPLVPETIGTRPLVPGTIGTGPLVPGTIGTGPEVPETIGTGPRDPGTPITGPGVQELTPEKIILDHRILENLYPEFEQTNNTMPTLAIESIKERNKLSYLSNPEPINLSPPNNKVIVTKLLPGNPVPGDPMSRKPMSKKKIEIEWYYYIKHDTMNRLHLLARTHFTLDQLKYMNVEMKQISVIQEFSVEQLEVYYEHVVDTINQSLKEWLTICKMYVDIEVNYVECCEKMINGMSTILNLKHFNVKIM